MTADGGLPVADQVERDIAALIGFPVGAESALTTPARRRARWAVATAGLAVLALLMGGVVRRHLMIPTPSIASPDRPGSEPPRAALPAIIATSGTQDRTPDSDQARGRVSPGATTAPMPARAAPPPNRHHASPPRSTTAPTGPSAKSAVAVADGASAAAAPPLKSATSTTAVLAPVRDPEASIPPSSGAARQPSVAAVPLNPVASPIVPPDRPGATPEPARAAASDRHAKVPKRQQMDALDALRLLRRQ